MAMNVFFLLASLCVTTANGSSPADEALADQLHNHGTHKQTSPERRRDLVDILTSAAEEARQLDYACEIQSMAEVFLTHRSTLRNELDRLQLAGFAVYLMCEEAPSPGVILYYNLKHRYLRAFEQVD